MWEVTNQSGQSCCLHYCGTDICNPDQPCSGFLKKDLQGILDYIVRLSTIDSAKIEPHRTFIAQLKQYIQSLLLSPFNSIAYQNPEPRSVQFYHEILEACATKTKDGKQNASSASTAKAKGGQNDYVTQYLVRMGLLKKWQ